MTEICPCCGSLIMSRSLSWSREARTVMRNGVAAVLSPREAAVFDVLWKARTAEEPLTRRALHERAWADDPDGGPLSDSAPSVQVSHINKRLAPLGVRINRQRIIVGWIRPEVISRPEALLRGLKRYFTGRPCRRGHVCERFVTGQCVECMKLSSLKFYHKDIEQTREVSRARRVEKIDHYRELERKRARRRRRRLAA